MKSLFFQKVVWAVDTMEPGEFQKNAQFVIGAITRETDAKVYPVHILNYPFANPVHQNDFEEAYLALAEKRLKKLSDNLEIPQITEGKTLVNRDGSVRKAVELLIEYAQEKEADVIVVGTHSRGTLAKFFMGSFAESLILRSEIPVITVNSFARVREKISRILFPSTFQEKFRDAFKEAVKLSSILGAELTVFYKEPFIPMLEVSGELAKVLEQERVARASEAEYYREWAEHYRVPLEILMDTAPGNVADAIDLYAADHNFDLIAMVSETHPFEGPRMGGICRRVVRSAECPVWTMKTEGDGDDETN